MAYAQWVETTIKPLNVDVTVKNISLSWGKLYQQGNKDNEISPDSINGQTISPHSTLTICSCGRENASSGTEGSFDLYVGDLKIGNYYWDCPWSDSDNKSVWNSCSDILVQNSGGNPEGGALGNVTLTIIDPNKAQ